MHVSREPQDDGYTVLPAKESRAPERSLSDRSLTIESSSDVLRKRKNPKQVRENRVFLLLVHCFDALTFEDIAAWSYLSDRDHKYLMFAFISLLLLFNLRNLTRANPSQS